MLPTFLRDHERPSPHWAHGLLSFPFGVRVAAARDATPATLARGPGLKRLVGQALRRATGLPKLFCSTLSDTPTKGSTLDLITSKEDLITVEDLIPEDC
ncbi:hypothetical protein NDU88_004408 [Pleurodeles waltl]|uniref:Uncharacterized protein n=1 Tax=Pleurodeles waltl TaxID=8319 RepID=A0AAV7LHZ3_PLEWA|nr:hypothetical protein NDU88_004408 [Pleurodeles waltl]